MNFLSMLVPKQSKRVLLARGKFRSKPWASVLDEAKRLVASGVKELNLIAEDTNQYGMVRGLQTRDRAPVCFAWMRHLTVKHAVCFHARIAVCRSMCMHDCAVVTSCVSYNMLRGVQVSEVFTLNLVSTCGLGRGHKEPLHPCLLFVPGCSVCIGVHCALCTGPARWLRLG